MPRTSTAERYQYVCPLCGETLGHDHDYKGWVRHEARPDAVRLLADESKRAMMSPEDQEYLRWTGLCPFERGQKDSAEPPPPRFLHLGPRQGSQYRQFFLSGTRIRAESIYRETVGDDPQTPEQVAEAYRVPVEAVLEAIEYCEHNDDLLKEERDEDWADIRARGLDRPVPAPAVEIPV